MFKVCEPHQQVSNDQDHQVKDQTCGLARDLHAVPQCLNPLSTQDPDNNDKAVEEIALVPAWILIVGCNTVEVVCVVVVEHLRSDYTKHEDHEEQNQSQVPQSLHRGPDNLHPQVEGRPPSAQPKHSDLNR